MDMHPELILAARVALGLTREDLATDAGIGERTLADLEGGRRSSVETYFLVRQALERMGIIFQAPTSEFGPGFCLPQGWKGSVIIRPRKTRRGVRKTKASSFSN